MKYVLNFIFFFISFLSIIFLSLNDQNHTSIATLNDNSNEDYYQVFDIYTTNLTSNNFNRYFSNTNNILAITPKVSSIYKSRLKNTSFNCEQKCSIQDFVNYYINILNDNNFKNDAINLKYYGIPIEKIKVYSTNNKIKELLKKCSICTVK